VTWHLHSECIQGHNCGERSGTLFTIKPMLFLVLFVVKDSEGCQTVLLFFAMTAPPSFWMLGFERLFNWPANTNLRNNTEKQYQLEWQNVLELARVSSTESTTSLHPGSYDMCVERYWGKWTRRPEQAVGHDGWLRVQFVGWDACCRYPDEWSMETVSFRPLMLTVKCLSVLLMTGYGPSYVVWRQHHARWKRVAVDSDVAVPLSRMGSNILHMSSEVGYVVRLIR